MPSAVDETRRQPAEAAVPSDDGEFVPWMASWSPPDQPAGRLGWWPESPNAYQPKGPPGSPVAIGSVTLNRPDRRGGARCADGGDERAHHAGCRASGSPAGARHVRVDPDPALHGPSSAQRDPAGAAVRAPGRITRAQRPSRRSPHGPEPRRRPERRAARKLACDRAVRARADDRAVRASTSVKASSWRCGRGGGGPAAPPRAGARRPPRWGARTLLEVSRPRGTRPRAGRLPDPLLPRNSAPAYAFLSNELLQNGGSGGRYTGGNPRHGATMGKHRTLGGLAVIATAVAVPMLSSSRTRPRDYTRTREFRALVGDYVI